MKKIPIAKPFLSLDEAELASEVILSGWVTQGPKVQEFEEKFADYVGSKYAVAVSNCTAALHLALLIAGIKEGDEVICPSMSFIATANSIRYVGATPVFAEVDHTFNLDINDVQRKISSKTKAILLVHQIGMPADIDEFKSLCDQNKLELIEDAACAIGSKYKDRMIGAHSDLVCFSFHPRKVITTGDGGMITTSNREYFERLKLLRQHGMSINDRQRHESAEVIFEEYIELGYNYRMTDIQAALGIVQLEKLEKIVEGRRAVASQYHEAFKNHEYLIPPLEDDGMKSNYQSYCLRLSENSPLTRNQLMQKLLDQGITTRRGIMNSHQELAYKDYHDVHLPNSEKLSDQSLLIPLYYPMADDEVNYVIQQLTKCFG